MNTDWWWAGDAELADGFGETFDKFAAYSKQAIYYYYYYYYYSFT